MSIREAFRFVFLAADGRLRAGWRALVYLPVYVALTLALVAPLAALVGEARLRDNIELRLVLSGWGAAPAAALAGYWLLLRLDRRSFRTLGFWFYDGWGREFALGLLSGLALLSAVVGLLLITGQVKLRAAPLDFDTALRGLGWTVIALFPAAAHEELVFRGYPFQRLVEAWGAFFAILLPSVLFGAAHLGNPQATPLSTANTILIGVLLAAMYLRTRGLWLPTGFHFAWNFVLGFIYSLPVSGINLSKKLLAAEIGEPVWLTGGNYGPEGSVITTGLTVVATVWLWKTPLLSVSPTLAKELELSPPAPPLSGDRPPAGEGA